MSLALPHEHVAPPPALVNPQFYQRWYRFVDALERGQLVVNRDKKDNEAGRDGRVASDAVAELRRREGARPRTFRAL